MENKTNCLWVAAATEMKLFKSVQLMRSPDLHGSTYFLKTHCRHQEQAACRGGGVALTKAPNKEERGNIFHREGSYFSCISFQLLVTSILKGVSKPSSLEYISNPTSGQEGIHANVCLGQASASSQMLQLYQVPPCSSLVDLRQPKSKRFFAQCIMNLWNSLPSDGVSTASIKGFQRSLVRFSEDMVQHG